ncbi:hypothetical protein QLL95_gp0918 [Cotonvirus japonicus]|uniref:Uncharacterized protein n=1 Tax=Cotonvirus japonicus TaxID=2811091 RepID=A0ABM7NSQ7_9VIRU|nr:hypothetical protein QLL95_gp0918 [Cotonvirus japonicus]BCS83205.1 hypothetical protein [Cotonvirus japonicus]
MYANNISDDTSTNESLDETSNKLTETLNDSSNSNNQEEFPLKSVYGRKCISKCYPKKHVYLHPLLLTGISDAYNESCAIAPAHTNDPRYYKGHTLIYADICKVSDNKDHVLPNELDNILLTFNFYPNDFLSGVYNLHSFDDVIYWTLENDFLPFNTIKRVHDCSWKVYGNKLDNLSKGVLNYYYDISKNYWLKDYVVSFEKTYSFNFSESDKIKIIESSDDANISDTFEEIYDIIVSKFYDYDSFVKFIEKYILKYSDTWNFIDSHYDYLKKFIYDSLSEHIEKMK